MSLLLDIQGTADLTNITFNGGLQKVAGGGRADVEALRARTAAGRRSRTPKFKNQGQCVSYVASHGRQQHHK